MQKRNLIFLALFFSTYILAISVRASGVATVRCFAFSETSYINKLSDNGLWAVASNVDANNSTLENYPYLLNIATGASLALLSEQEMLSSPDCGARDVTDDGKNIVGSYKGKPAVCRIGDDGKPVWHFLPLPADNPKANGYVTAVTPDGTYMVGTLHNNSANLDGGYEEYPVMWKNGEVVELPDIPTGSNGNQLCRLIDISADGQVIVGGLMYIYPDDISHFVYYTSDHTHEILGAKEFSSVGNAITSVCLSTNGEWVAGGARWVTYVDGSDYADQQEIPYTYNTRTKTFTAYTSNEHHGAAATAIFNNGLMAVAAPISNPYRTQMYFINGYYYTLDLILSERYGVDFQSASGLDNSGLPVSLSADGLTIASIAVNEGNHVVVLPESIEQAAQSVNLLARTEVAPVTGSSFSYFRSMTVTFDKAPTVVKGMQAALYKEGLETPVRTSISIVPADQSGQSRIFHINFRNTPLEDGVKYFVKVPAGTFRLGETDTYNKEISVAYTGRSEKPVKVVAVNLEDGMEIASLSYNIPVTMQFDTQIALAEGCKGALYQEGVSTPISELTLASSANMLAAYPATKRNLFKGINYMVKIPAGAVTDIMGNCANEEITYHYVGAYVPEAPADTLLFADDFADPSTSYNNFMLYEGDHLVPNATAQGWQFDADNTPWYFALRENEETTDYCAGSISMYNPAGQSDNWMVTNQLYLPNAFCFLSFDVQSYLNRKEDHLKVYVYADDAVYTTLNAEIVQNIRTYGTCIYHEKENCGTSEENLSGEWTQRRISLEAFAGKNIYIAFVNEDNDQSAVFVDNIRVIYKSNCLLGLNTKTTVVNQDDAVISGIVRITDEAHTHNAITVFYSDEKGTVSDTIRSTELNLTNGSVFDFTFDKKLPLSIGEENRFTVGVSLGGETKKTDFAIKNLAFETDKKVVVEEITGTWCSNCPDGMVALEHMEEALPGKVIPVCIHNNDIYANDDYAAALGLTALPTARVNRRDTVTAPIVINMDTYAYSFTSASGNESWMDHVLKELETEAEANVQLVSAKFDKSTRSVSIDTRVTYAINKAGVAANLFYVLLEDGLTGMQTNGRANASDPIYGDWGKNGRYGGQAVVQTSYHDVARVVLAGTQGSINGFSGIVPATVKCNTPIESSITFDGALDAVSHPLNAKVVCMLLDANTGRVINADVSSLTDADPESIHETVAGNALPVVSVNDGTVTVSAPTGQAYLYTPDGVLIDHAVVNGTTLLHTNGRQGMVIVRLVGDDGETFVQKLVIQ